MGNDLKVTEIFAQMLAAWRDSIPNALLRADPKLVITYLDLCDRKEGIFQMELKSKIRINQPKLSKLASKLVKAGYIAREIPVTDGRKCRTTTTAKGKELLANLEVKLTDAMSLRADGKSSRRSRKKRIKTVEGQQTFDLSNL